MALFSSFSLSAWLAAADPIITLFASAAFENITALQQEYRTLLSACNTEDAATADGCDANSLSDYNCTLQFAGDTTSYEERCAEADG